MLPKDLGAATHKSDLSVMFQSVPVVLQASEDWTDISLKLYALRLKHVIWRVLASRIHATINSEQTQRDASTK